MSLASVPNAESARTSPLSHKRTSEVRNTSLFRTEEAQHRRFSWAAPSTLYPIFRPPISGVEVTSMLRAGSGLAE